MHIFRKQVRDFHQINFNLTKFNKIMIPGSLMPTHQCTTNILLFHKTFCYQFTSTSAAKSNTLGDNMECIFCEKKNSQVSRYYHFLRGIQISLFRSSNVDSKKMCFELYTKYTKKVHRTQLGHFNCILIQLCVTELI